ncbi:hypothetical protein [Amycolatopsis sp. NPDC051102]|uniref:hypothetical protein n=1 Tax=Amycolatopsis sp. NPDC051102 TaxID=3155163 RepID=UPI0034348FCB
MTDPDTPGDVSPQVARFTGPDLAAVNLLALSTSLTEYLMDITIGLLKTGVPLDSKQFGLGLTKASTAILRFCLKLREIKPIDIPVDTLQAASLSRAERGSWPPHRQQTLELLRFIDLLTSHVDAFGLADDEDTKAAAFLALTELAVISGTTFNFTARLMAALTAHRGGQDLAEIAAGLHTTPDDVEQMLIDAEALLAGPPSARSDTDTSPAAGAARTTESQGPR